MGINFFDWSLEKARSYPRVFAIVEREVKPERQRLGADGKYKLRKPLPQRWWQYGEKAPALSRAISSLDHVVVMPRISKPVLPLRYPAGLVFSELTIVFARPDHAFFGLLTSNLHRFWARRFSSTLAAQTNYSPTNAFQTFPMPRDLGSDIGKIACELEDCRLAAMRKFGLGLTATYNRVHLKTENDHRIQELRALHSSLDEAVCNSYGWKNVDLNYGFYETDEGVRWTIGEAAQNEILDRLLELNYERHRQEVSNGLAIEAGSSTNGKRASGQKARTSSDEQIALMGEHGNEA